MDTPQPLTPRPLMQIVSGLWASKTLAAACELELFTQLSATGPLTLQAIGDRLALRPRPTETLVTACASLGLLDADAGRYGNSALSEEFLVKGKRYYFGGWVTGVDVHDYPGWMRLMDALRTDRPTAWNPDERSSLFDPGDPDMVDFFWQAMHSLSVFTAGVLADSVDLGGVRNLLDIGGGGAAYAIELCRRHPELTTTIYDLPFVCDLTRPVIDKAGLTERIELISGDFFAEPRLPGGYDACLLSMILHDWSEDDCRKLLAKCYRALAPGGQILISELLVNDAKDGPADAALMSLTMLVETWGRNYTAAEYGSWLKDTGFTQIRVEHFEAPGANGVVIARKPT
ncbi:methyltransferase [Actinomadura macrotermitis]|uniref:3-hydroxy-5-methyl-1-naphthoate 3-O-methyltransferase n=1 Tax=Actinomadura macrotermitis TaxID=2585200 RepID=A0A7K0BPU6_9ACTN|nr:methyltransferase [Actinomadura macrotermitis]MQY03208.1 3-hydroxy-5-methyl-1-naphthoate 3-O-methyltransferase [Actinomadura macrotermitis]